MVKQLERALRCDLGQLTKVEGPKGSAVDFGDQLGKP